MKLATYRWAGADRVGVVDVEGQRVLDLAAAARRDGVSDAWFASMLSLVDADDAGLDLARRLLERRGDDAELWSPLAEVGLLAPLPEPRQIRDAMSFALHVSQAARGARAMKALRDGGRDAFQRRWRRRSRTSPLFSAKFRSITSPTVSPWPDLARR